MNIHVFLIDYQFNETLTSALHSLKLIDPYISSITIFLDENIAINPPQLRPTIRIKKFQENQLNHLIGETIATFDNGYALFLYQNELLISNSFIDKIKKEENTIYIHQLQLKNLQLLRPYLIKMSTLKQSDFFNLYKFPFFDCLLHAFLFTLDRSKVNIYYSNDIKHLQLNLTNNMLERKRFSEKFSLKKVTFAPQYPTISIMIAAYNMSDYIEQTVSSCLLQTTLPEQVIIIDDGSTDDTLQKIKRLASFPIVSLFKQENSGKAKALNNILNLIKTDFVIEIDADDWLDPDAIYTIKKKLQFIKDDVSVLYGNFREWKQLNSTFLLYKGIRKGWQIQSKHDLLNYNFPLGPRIYKTSLLKRISGFPILPFEEGRFYEDVSVLHELLKMSNFLYKDFTIYNIRNHESSITKRSHSKWNDFLNHLT